MNFNKMTTHIFDFEIEIFYKVLKKKLFNSNTLTITNEPLLSLTRIIMTNSW